MKHLVALLFSFCFLFPVLGNAQDFTATRPSQSEENLFIAINDWRAENGLPKILYSPELSWLARRHTEDQQEIGLTHDWSTPGAPGVFGIGVNQFFEISCFVSGGSISVCLNLWKNSPGHNTTILEQGIWDRFDWQMMGVGTDGTYTNVYFTNELTQAAFAIPQEEPEPPVEPEPPELEFIDTSDFPVGLFTSETLGQQAIQLVGDDFERLSGVWYTFLNNGSPIWFTFIAEQIEPNLFAGDLLRATGTVYDGALSFDPSVGTIELTMVNENEFRVVLDWPARNFLEAVTLTRWSW